MARISPIVFQIFSCCYKKEKLIVSRQPIFTNLKSNTMKNIANIRTYLILCKCPSKFGYGFNDNCDLLAMFDKWSCYFGVFSVLGTVLLCSVFFFVLLTEKRSFKL